ncbi:sialidase family protein [Tahibacter caeni]|uniref:sialidase family protein n=1 Tax=Tahibacter caeni TaxID=1453545 RepID=UPI0021485BBE|nr:hypothetical protein [Tahibacter caeni]
MAAPAQRWTSVGPDGGYVGYLLADPNVPGRIYAAGYGLYVSSDAGRSWRSASVGLQAKARMGLGISADPDQPGRLYLIDFDGRLMRSDDSAASWSPTGYAISLAAAPFGRGRIAMADIPASTTDLLIAPGDGYVYRSSDSGESFVAIAYLGYNNRTIDTLAVDPQNPQNVFAGMGYGTTGSINGTTLLRSGDGGTSWNGASGVPVIGSGSSIVFQPNGNLVAVLNGRVHVSSNGGQAWTASAVNAYLLAVAPIAGHEVIAMSATRCAKSQDFLAGSESCDAGLPTSGSGFTDLAAVADGVGGYRALATGSVVGVRASDSAASGWVASNAGLSSRQFRGVAIVPGHPQRLLAGYWSSSALEDAPLFSTRDAGAHWQIDLTGQLRYVRTLAADTTAAAIPDAMTVYAGGQYLTQNFQPINSGLFRSSDGGISWQAPLGAGLPTSGTSTVGNIGLIRKLQIDPRSCAQPPARGYCRQGPLNTVFALASREGWRVAKGMQRGDDWSSGDNGLPLATDNGIVREAIFPWDLGFDVADGVIYLGALSDAVDWDNVIVSGSLQSGVFRSTDGGLHWQHRSNGLPLKGASTQTAQDVHAVVAHPRRSGVVWASTVQPGNATRIYKTLDGGANWFPSGPELAGCDVRDLQVDRSAPDVVYAVGSGLGFRSACIYRSEDGGSTWLSVADDAPGGEIYDLTWDEHDQARLVMTTDTGVYALRAPSDKIFVANLED